MIEDFRKASRNSTSLPCSPGGVFPATTRSRLHRSYTKSSLFASLDVMMLLMDCTASWGEPPGAFSESTMPLGVAIFNLVNRAGAAAYALRNMCPAVTRCIIRLTKNTTGRDPRLAQVASFKKGERAEMQDLCPSLGPVPTKRPPPTSLVGPPRQAVPEVQRSASFQAGSGRRLVGRGQRGREGKERVGVLPQPSGPAGGAGPPAIFRVFACFGGVAACLWLQVRFVAAPSSTGVAR